MRPRFKIQWVRRSGTATDLRQLEIPPGDAWGLGTFFEKVHTAVRSGIPRISEFDAMSEDDRAILIAYWRALDKMAAWERWTQEQKARANG